MLGSYSRNPCSSFIVIESFLSLAPTASVFLFSRRMDFPSVGSRLSHPKYTHPLLSPVAALHGVDLSCLPSPSIWILNLGAFSRAVMNPVDHSVSSSALVVIMAASSGSLLTSPLVISFILPANTGNLSACRGLANFASAGRESRHLQPLTSCHLPRRLLPPTF